MSEVSLAGVTLYQPTPDVKVDIERVLRPQLARVFQHNAWAGPQGYGRDRWSPVAHEPSHPFEVGSFYWPCGASRFAYGHFLTHAGDLDKITDVGLIAGVPQAVPLKIGDEVETLVYLLPSFPLYASEDCQVRILTVVDERYFWWFRKNDISINVGTTTWAALLTSINSALLTTITSDAVSADYLKPGWYLTSPQEYLPLLIDAVAYNTGLRFVRDLDGNNKLMSYDTSAALEAANVTKTKWMGGQMRLGTGGEERALVLPEKVVVRFNRGCHNYYYVEKTLVGLAISGMNGIVGFAGAKHFHDQKEANGTIGVPSNDAELQALAARIATDWYKHQLGQEFVAYREIVNVAPHGLMDSITWRANGDECSTTVYRPELNDQAEELVHGGSEPPCDTGTTVIRRNTLVAVNTGFGTEEDSGFRFTPPTKKPNPTKQSVSTDTLTTSQNDYSMATQSKGILRINASTADINITGFSGGSNGRVIEIENVGTKTIRLPHEDSGSSASNQISIPNGATVKAINVPPKSVVSLKYNGPTSKWTPMFQWCCGGQPVASGRSYQVPATASMSSDTDDYQWPNATILALNVTAACALTGIAGQPSGAAATDGQMIEIQNVGTEDLTIPHEDSGSSSANQFTSPTENDYIIKPKETVAFKYNGGESKWFMLWSTLKSVRLLAVESGPSNSITTGSTDPVEWTNADKDDYGWISLGDYWIEVPADGWYRFAYQVDGDLAVLTDDGVVAWLATDVAGTPSGPIPGTRNRSHSHNIGQAITLSCSGFVQLAAGDKVYLIINNESMVEDFVPGDGQLSLEFVDVD